MRALGPVVERLRTERGLSRQALAAMAGVGVSTLYGIERADSIPQAQTLNDLVMSLASVAPLVQADAVELAEATGRVPGSFLSSNPATAPRSMPTPKRDGDLEELEQVINELLAHAPLASVLRLLRGLRDTLAVMGGPRTPQPRPVRVVFPPRPGPIPGSVSQEFHHYDVYDDEAGGPAQARAGG